MPVNLVGQKVKFIGKTLWEICGNLKNFGVGRLILKSHFNNYPEASYYKIVKVQPDIAPTDKYKNRKVMVWAEHVFRGKKYPELVQMHERTYKTQFQLVPRSEEYLYTSAKLADRTTFLPTYRDFPPLLKILLERECQEQNKRLNPMKTVVTENRNAVAVVQEDGSILKDKKPNLWVEKSVADLTKTLEQLKSSATGTNV